MLKNKVLQRKIELFNRLIEIISHLSNPKLKS